jgi:hypothetical protein
MRVPCSLSGVAIKLTRDHPCQSVGESTRSDCRRASPRVLLNGRRPTKCYRSKSVCFENRSTRFGRACRRCRPATPPLISPPGSQLPDRTCSRCGRNPRAIRARPAPGIPNCLTTGFYNIPLESRLLALALPVAIRARPPKSLPFNNAGHFPKFARRPKSPSLLEVPSVYRFYITTIRYYSTALFNLTIVFS